VTELQISTNSSFDEERREVLESVMGALSSAVSDPDEMAACRYLLRHLAGRTVSRAARSAMLTETEKPGERYRPILRFKVPDMHRACGEINGRGASLEREPGPVARMPGNPTSS
jgi:hypothetical protein